MHVSPFEQRVRNAIVAYHARWFGRAPSTDELLLVLSPAARSEIEAALDRLREVGYILGNAAGWSIRTPVRATRAGDAMASHARLGDVRSG